MSKREMREAKRLALERIGIYLSEQQKSEPINIGEFKLRKCSVSLTHLSSKIVESSSIDCQPGTSKRLLQTNTVKAKVTAAKPATNGTQNDLQQKNTVIVKKRKPTKATADAKLVSLNCLPTAHKTEGFSELEIRKMSKCSVVLYRLSPEALVAPEMGKTKKLPAKNGQQKILVRSHGANDVHRENSKVKSQLHAEKSTATKPPQAAPIELIAIKTENKSSNDSDQFDLSMDDAVQTGKAKKANKTKKFYWDFARMVNVNSTIDDSKVTKRKVKAEPKSVHFRDEIENVQNDDQKNALPLAPAPKMSNRSNAVMKRLPLQNIVSISCPDALRIPSF